MARALSDEQKAAAGEAFRALGLCQELAEAAASLVSGRCSFGWQAAVAMELGVVRALCGARAPGSSRRVARRVRRPRAFATQDKQASALPL